MRQPRAWQTAFRRERRPGDIAFAWIFLALSLFLLSQIGVQTAWKDGGKLFAQPRFWPAVSLSAMAVFAALHVIGSYLSPRIHGRWREVLFWVRGVEFAGWFIAYAMLVPRIGYLPATLLVVLTLLMRSGYRTSRAFLAGALVSVTVVVLFRAVLQVKLPGGAVYQYLPDGLHQLMLTYF